MSQNLPLLMAVCNVASAREKNNGIFPPPPKKTERESEREGENAEVRCYWALME